MADHIVPEWYFRMTYAERCGVAGTDQYARGVQEFDQFIANVRAKAWNEGYRSGGMLDEPNVQPAVNPYLEEK